MRILSCDPGTENFGIAVIEYNANWKHDVNNCLDMCLAICKQEYDVCVDESKPCDVCILQKLGDELHKLNKIIDSHFRILFEKRVAFCENKSVKKYDQFLERTAILKGILDDVKQSIGTLDYVVIEHQMKQNDITRMLSSQIAMYYIKPSNNFQYAYSSSDTPSVNDASTNISVTKFPEVVIVNPRLKNMISFDETHNLAYFLSKYTDYVAGKKHAVNNFILYVEKCQSELSSRIDKKKRLCDVADAFMNAYAWVKFVFECGLRDTESLCHDPQSPPDSTKKSIGTSSGHRARARRKILHLPVLS
jgi:hypothetical protein